MSQTLVVIGYSPNQGVRRTTVIPDDDNQVSTYVNWIRGIGESVLVGTMSDYKLMGPDAMLARFLGRSRTTDRCAVINSAGYVVSIICADPLMDSHPEGRLHHDPSRVAVVGQQSLNLGLFPWHSF